MSEMSEARTHIVQANEVTRELRRRLTGLHAELLELERLADRTDTGMLVVDRADDLRRQLAGPLQEQAQLVRPALAETETAYFHAATSGQVDPDHARTMTGVVLQTARETRHMQLGINQAATSLQQVVSTSPSDPGLPALVRNSVHDASTALDHARRGAHRVCEDLPLLERSLAIDVAAPADQGRLPLPSGPDTGRSPGRVQEDRQLPRSVDPVSTGVTR